MNESAISLPDDAPLPTTPDMLYAYLDNIGVAYKIYGHEAVFTVAQGEDLKRTIPGLHCRNLFFRDKKKQMFLVVVGNDTKIDLKKLPEFIGSARLSFGSPARLWQYLGIRAGSVCPFTIINDKDHAVTIILDKAMMAEELVNYHPMENDKTIGLSPDDLIKFVRSCGHEVNIVDLGPAAPSEE